MEQAIADTAIKNLTRARQDRFSNKLHAIADDV